MKGPFSDSSDKGFTQNNFHSLEEHNELFFQSSAERVKYCPFVIFSFENRWEEAFKVSDGLNDHDTFHGCPLMLAKQIGDEKLIKCVQEMVDQQENRE